MVNTPPPPPSLPPPPPQSPQKNNKKKKQHINFFFNHATSLSKKITKLLDKIRRKKLRNLFAKYFNKKILNLNHVTSPKLYQSYYPHRLRDSVSPVCGICSKKKEKKGWFLIICLVFIAFLAKFSCQIYQHKLLKSQDRYIRLWRVTMSLNRSYTSSFK